MSHVSKSPTLGDLKAKAKALEAQVAETKIAIDKIEDVDRCESCHTPNQKAKKCTSCLGPTVRPAKDEE